MGFGIAAGVAVICGVGDVSLECCSVGGADLCGVRAGVTASLGSGLGPRRGSVPAACAVLLVAVPGPHARGGTLRQSCCFVANYTTIMLNAVLKL